MNVYTVQAGDTLETIAKKFLVSITDLQKWNNGQFPSLYSTTLPMTPGWVINIAPPSRSTYNVTDFGAIGHDITRNDGSVIAGSTSFVSKDGTFKSGDVGTNITVDYAATNTTLSDMLIQGASYSLLTVNPLTTEIAGGANVVVQFGTYTQTFVAAATAPVGAIYVTVTAQVANYSYPIGSYVDPANLTTTITSVSSPTLVTLGADATITAFGLSYTYTPDDTAAIQTAINACSIAGGGIVYLPTGTYNVSPGVNNYDLQLLSNVTIAGASQYATTIYDQSQNSSNPVPIIYSNGTSNVGVRDIGLKGNVLSSTQANFNGGGVLLVGVNYFELRNLYCSYFTNYGFHIGTVGGGTGGCTYGTIDSVTVVGYRMGAGGISTGSNINVNNLLFYTGEGFNIENGPCNAINVSNVVAIHNDTVQPGTAFGYALDVVANDGDMSAINISNVYVYGQWLTGIEISADLNGSTNYNVSDIAVSNCILDGSGSASNYGVLVSADSGSVMERVSFTSCMAKNWAAADGFHFDNAKNITLVNCISYNNAQQGYGIFAGSEVRFTGCQALSNNTSNASGNSGFYLDTSTAYLVNCISGGGNQNYGLRGVTAPCNLYASDCDFTGNTDGSVLVGGGNGGRVSNCLGYNPTGPQTAPTIPASGTSLTNPFPFDTTVYVTGGTVTAIAVGGTSTGLTSGSVFIPVGETITLTYSSAPTWIWIGN